MRTFIWRSLQNLLVALGVIAVTSGFVVGMAWWMGHSQTGQWVGVGFLILLLIPAPVLAVIEWCRALRAFYRRCVEDEQADAYLRHRAKERQEADDGR